MSNTNPHPPQLPAPHWVPCLMEWSHTTLVPTWPQPPTSVTLGTLWLVPSHPSPVIRPQGSGVALRDPLVNVRNICYNVHIHWPPCIQWFVQTSPSQHHLCTVTPPSPEMMAPWLPTPVTLATRWLDWWWGCVVSVDGALVRGMCCWTDIKSSPTAICPVLTLSNGFIVYDPNSSPVLEGAMATHACVTGYQLSLSPATRICQSDRMWSGDDITCERICTQTDLMGN